MYKYTPSPIFLKDFYKTDHRRQYPAGTQEIYSNFTARASRLSGVDKVVCFGIQYLVEEYFQNQWQQNFFQNDINEGTKTYLMTMNYALGAGAISPDHLRDLHNLGYLPIIVKAIPEGTLVPLRVPMLTIRNTHPDFFWLPNFLETMISAVLWHPMTCATLAFEYRKILHQFAKETSDSQDAVLYQCHDFSMRGHSSIESGMVAGAAHLLSFLGTDTIPAINFLSQFYGGGWDGAHRDFIGGSVPATEHSVMCAGGCDNELETFRHLITQLYPKGIVSIVSDTWNYWKVLGVILPTLKEEIMKREGKVVIRPDSGDPVDILCGDVNAVKQSSAYIGTVEYLWHTFGGTVNSKGYRELDSHIGVIYGDSITLERAKTICERLKQKGFASTNVVFGVGSYTYQYVTRDTFGFAMKATRAVINYKPQDIYKDPVTDDGTKKSAKGLLRVNTDLTLSEQVSEDDEMCGLLQTVFCNGKKRNTQSLAEIRKRLAAQLL